VRVLNLFEKEGIKMTDDFFEDYNDDFYDDFSEDGDFMDDDSFEDAFDDDFDSEDSLVDDVDSEDESTEDNICGDNITMEDAVFIGGTMMGWGYEEGLEEAERRRLEKKMDKEAKDNEKDDF